MGSLSSKQEVLDYQEDGVLIFFTFNATTHIKDMGYAN